MSRQVRREIAVVKLGGTTLAEQSATLEEVAALSARQPIVLVHGGGKRLTEWLDRLGVPTRFENGLRATDDATVEVALAVLGGLVNGELVVALRGLGADPVGLTGLDGGLLRAERVAGLGRVGHVVSVRRYLLDALLATGAVPVVAPIALDPDGLTVNVNADDAAAAIAGAMAARLVLLTDVDGVRGRDGVRVPALTADEARALVAEGTASGGMVPKIGACLDALSGGARDALIADGGAPRALARALTDRTFGTRVTGRSASRRSTPPRAPAPLAAG